MDYVPLGKTKIKVSPLCLGTMTWGEQNTKQDAFQQLDYALEQGINFVDTAEMYPVPPIEQTQGRTEAYIGEWLKERKNRDSVVLATKVTGRSDGFSYLREGNICLNRRNIEKALDDSLKRLQTDYIDLYQLHWPDRKTNFFGELGYTHDKEDTAVPLEDSLRALEDAVQAGKIRAIGLSNETPWGVLECLRLAESANLPRVVSIQNPYNLLNRTFEVGLAEIAIREQVGLLAYSPLAFGVLSGKYLGGQQPENARLTRFQRFQRYTNKRSIAATEAYHKIAEDHGLNFTQMALAFVTQQPFVTSNIIGATTLVQLKQNIESYGLRLSDAVLKDINAVHSANPNPAP